ILLLLMLSIRLLMSISYSYQEALEIAKIDPVVFDPADAFTLQGLFRLGYGREKLSATITKIEIVDGKDTDLHIDKPVYAIHFYLQNTIQLGGRL
ncbi:MAG: hypothetical protein ACTTH7_10370, partial [Treponema sp.]